MRAAARNREPIFDVLRHHLPSRGLVLEVASGSANTSLTSLNRAGRILVSNRATQIPAPAPVWMPGPLHSISATSCQRSRSMPRQSVSPLSHADVVLCINLIHIAPWAAAVGLMRGAAGILPIGGVLFLDGPFRRNGCHTAPSNEAFDPDPRARNPAWGVRDLEAVAALAEAHGFAQPVVDEMPANNLSGRPSHGSCLRHCPAERPHSVAFPRTSCDGVAPFSCLPLDSGQHLVTIDRLADMAIHTRAIEALDLIRQHIRRHGDDGDSSLVSPQCTDGLGSGIHPWWASEYPLG